MKIIPLLLKLFAERLFLFLKKYSGISSIMPDSIRKRIIYASFFLVIIPLFCISIITGYFLSHKSESDFLERIDAELMQINGQMDIFVKNIFGDLNISGNLKIFKQTFNDKTINIYKPALVEIKNSDVKRGFPEKEVFDLEQLITDSKPDYDAVIFSSKKAQYITNSLTMKFIKGFDPRKRPDYIDAMAASGKPVMTKSFLATTGENVVIATQSFKGDNEDFSYVISIAFTLKQLAEKITSIHIGKTGYLILTDNDGTILAHPMKELLFKKISDLAPEVEKGIKTGKQTIYYNFRGVDKVARFTIEPNTGWIILGVINKNEINTASMFYKIMILITSIIITGFCILLYLYISKKIIIPIKQLTDFGHRIATGEPDSYITMNRNDELGKLANDFNSLMQKLQDSLISVKAIIEFMPSVIIQLDMTGNIIEWNRLAEEFAGCSIKNAKGKHLRVIKPEFEAILQNAKKCILNDQPFTLYKTNLSDKEKQYFNIFIFHLKLELSESIVVRLDDISEFVNNEIKLLQSQKLETIGQLASGIAHDLNNILGGILGAISILRYKLNNKTLEMEDLIKNLDLAEKSTNDGAAIIAQLLNFSRKETDIELYPSDLNNIIDNVLEICSSSFDPSIIIKINKYHEPANVMMNDVQIRQVVLNLCINAAHSMTIMKKANDNIGGFLEIGIKKITADKIFIKSHPESAEGEYFLLYVKDTGVGMDNKTISKIYEPFFTTKHNMSARGTGLGLFVVYSIIKAHRGFIDIYSEVGIGSVFNLFFPAADFKDILDINEQSTVMSGSGTILVIDDNRILRDETMMMLSECGYSVITATDGIDGISLYKNNSNRIDGVILDMVMPRQAGYETLVELLQMNPDLKILIASGFKLESKIEELKNAGAFDFIEKPYSISQLSIKIKNMLG